MKKQSKTEERLQEFETKGFVSANNTKGRLLNKIRKKHFTYFRKFNSAYRLNKGRTSFEIFGGKLFYYYDTRKKDEFIEFLVKKFYEKNPFPEHRLKSSFTYILHSNKLCWEGCLQHNLNKKR